MTPREELDDLLDSLLTVTREQLVKHGAVLPVALVLGEDGEREMVTAGEKGVSPADLEQLLIGSLAKRAASGKVRAVGIAVDMRLRESPIGATDALRVGLEHVEGDPVDVYLPYGKRRLRAPAFGELFALPRAPAVFAA